MVLSFRRRPLLLLCPCATYLIGKALKVHRVVEAEEEEEEELP
jgi:hypothetical protein